VISRGLFPIEIEGKVPVGKGALMHLGRGEGGVQAMKIACTTEKKGGAKQNIQGKESKAEWGGKGGGVKSLRESEGEHFRIKSAKISSNGKKGREEESVGKSLIC